MTPHPWEERRDPHGYRYYLNTQTGQTARSLPAASAAAASARSARSPPAPFPSTPDPRYVPPNASDPSIEHRTPDPTQRSGYTTSPEQDDDPGADTRLTEEVGRLDIDPEAGASGRPGLLPRGERAPAGPSPRPSLPGTSTSYNTTGTSAQLAPRTVHQHAEKTISSGNPRDPPGSAGLHPAYKVRRDAPVFFHEGKVFLTLHAESTTSPDDGRSEFTRGLYGEPVHQEISRFVVIRESHGSCAALRILTHGGRGCGKPGVHKADHARIYTTKDAPAPHDNERVLKRGEEPMQVLAFRVKPDRPGDKLDPMSRINLGKVYTIEHNVKVKPFGEVTNFDTLYRLHKQIWDRGLPLPQQSLPPTIEYPEEDATRLERIPPTPRSMSQPMPGYPTYAYGAHGYPPTVPSSSSGYTGMAYPGAPPGSGERRVSNSQTPSNRGKMPSQQATSSSQSYGQSQPYSAGSSTLVFHPNATNLVSQPLPIPERINSPPNQPIHGASPSSSYSQAPMYHPNPSNNPSVGSSAGPAAMDPQDHQALLTYNSYRRMITQQGQSSPQAVQILSPPQAVQMLVRMLQQHRPDLTNADGVRIIRAQLSKGAALQGSTTNDHD